MGRFYPTLKSAKLKCLRWTRLRPRTAASFGALALACFMTAGVAGGAYAQQGYPPGNIPGNRFGGNDTANLLVRIGRLESQVRSMTGQIEQLQFQMRRMQKQLEAFQKDVDFRFKDGSGKSSAPRRQNRRDRRGEINQPADKTPPARTADAELPPVKQQTPVVLGRSGQSGSRPGVFNPAANPGAPGAPRQLGSPFNLPSAPLTRGPLDGPAPGRNQSNINNADRGLPEPDSPLILSRPNPPVSSEPVRKSIALKASPLPPPDTSPRQTYRTALAALRNRQYNQAEQGLNDFLKRFPNSSLTPSVRYNLGVVYASRSRHREAAEQFLKVSTEHRKSSRAPDSLYRLGLSLQRLGAREQACASYTEVERRYPDATASLRARVGRQMKKANC